MCRLRQFDKPITNISKSSQKGTLLRRGRPRFDKRVVSGFLPDKLWGRLLNSSSRGISRHPPVDRSIGLQISPYLDFLARGYFAMIYARYALLGLT